MTAELSDECWIEVADGQGEHIYGDLNKAGDALVAEFAEGTLSPPIFDRLPLSEARRAHELMDSRAILGKLILKP